MDGMKVDMRGCAEWVFESLGVALSGEEVDWGGYFVIVVWEVFGAELQDIGVFGF